MPQNPFGQPPGPPSYPGAYPQGYNPMSPPGTQFMAGQYAPAMPASNGVGTAGGVVGIVAAVLLWFPYVGLILGVIGVALGAVGLNRSNRLYGAGKGMSIAGIVCGGVALIINILFIVAISTAISTVH
jgi:hypothetical protein